MHVMYVPFQNKKVWPSRQLSLSAAILKTLLVVAQDAWPDSVRQAVNFAVGIHVVHGPHVVHVVHVVLTILCSTVIVSNHTPEPHFHFHTKKTSHFTHLLQPATGAGHSCVPLVDCAARVT